MSGAEEAADEGRALEAVPDVIRLIKKAAARSDLRRRARIHLARLLEDGDLLADYPAGERRAAIFPSDYGSCALALWAEKHGLADIPRDGIDDQLARLDMGSLIGAWEACLFKAGAESEGVWFVELEYEPGRGHIDALASSPPWLVPVEFKSSYGTGAIKEPEDENPAHLLQLGDYGEQVDAKHMVLVALRPPAKAGERMKQFVRDVAPFVPLVAAERARLAPALGDEAPVADPQAAWACFTCRYAACKKNKNKNANSSEVLFA